MKIFQIGFNRCGTVSLWKYFEAQQIKAVHWEYGNLARSMYCQIKRGGKLLQNYKDTVFFSDMESDLMIDGKPGWLYAHVDYYKLLDEQYPGSKFILNTRKVDDWLASRSHFCMSPNGDKEEYLSCAKTIHNTDKEGVYALWHKQWNDHHKDVREHFKSRSQDLLIYDIDVDDSSKIVEFFRGTLELASIELPKLNAGNQK